MFHHGKKSPKKLRALAGSLSPSTPKGSRSSSKKLGANSVMTFEEADDRIRDIFEHHGFKGFPHALRRQLTQFYFLLINDQSHHNSTRLRALRDVAIKHFIDSLRVTELTQLSFPLLDVGTGPGFPGIPIKLLYPSQKMVLAEGVQKRVEFLKRVRDELQLSQLDIIGRQVNTDFHYPVAAVITRAVADTVATLTQVKNCLNAHGKVFLMKGPNVDEELIRFHKNPGGFRLIEDHAYELVNTPHKRRLLVFQKKSTETP